MKHFITTALALVLCPGALATTKPNIIFILADDLGYGDVGFNGQKHIKTPSLDRMAAEGMVFNQHYSGSTVCMPARACLLTGMDLGHVSIRGNPGWMSSPDPINLGKEEITVAEELKRAGYDTAIIGKWGLAEADDSGMPLNRGFDYFFGARNHLDAHHFYPPHLWRNNEKVMFPENDTQNTTGTYSHDLFTSEALRFVSEKREKPYFLYLAYTIPHLELTVPEDSKKPYLELGWPKRKMTKAHYRNDPEGNVTYAAMVSRMDRDIGQLMDRLNGQGAANNTLVIFTSDNGPEYEKEDGFFNSNGPFRGGKRDLYEGGIRVPTVTWWPGKIASGTRTDHISAFWDFLPTACEAAGIEPSRDVSGISYLPTLVATGTQKKHDSLYWEFNEREGPMQALRMGKWKAVRFIEQDRIELYDLDADPGEAQNTANGHPDLTEKLKVMFASARTPSQHFPLKMHDKKSK